MSFEEVLDKLKKHKSNWYDCELELDEMNVIIPILEKAVEKKLTKEREYKTCPDYKCPDCGRYISPYTENYCSDCGQKLDWEE